MDAFHTSSSLYDLMDTKTVSSEERRKIIITSVALKLIGVALHTEGSSHKLSEEMENLEDYVKKIEAAIK